MDECRLRAANGLRGIPCDGPSCILWRVVGQLDLIEGMEEDGCAVTRFGLLDSGEKKLVSWLLQVKHAVENEPVADIDPLPLPLEPPHLPN